MAADLITCGHLYEELNKKQGFKTMVLRQCTRQEEFEDLGWSGCFYWLWLVY